MLGNINTAYEFIKQRPCTHIKNAVSTNNIDVSLGDRMSWMDESHFLELWYKKTQNPYFVWSAYKFFRNTNRPVPKWVLSYLDKSASQLLLGKDPLSSLSFEDSGSDQNILNSFYSSIEHVHIITEYAELIETHSSIDAIETLVKKYNKSQKDIEKILKDAVQPNT